MNIKKVSIDLNTNGSGAATGRSLPLIGRLLGVEISKRTLADTADLTITNAGATSQTIATVSNLTANRWLRPGGPYHDASAGVIADSNGPLFVSGAFVVVVAEGGDNKTGTVTFYVEC